MVVIAITGIAYVLFGALPSNGDQVSAAQLRIELQALTEGVPLVTVWQGKSLVILKPVAAVHSGDILIALNYGTVMGCPLVYHPAGDHEAPIHPWPGGFRESCSNSWYDNAGRALPDTEAVRALRRPPHRITAEGVLWIGND